VADVRLLALEHRTHEALEHEADGAFYRLLACEAIHALHAMTAERDRLKRQCSDLREQIRTLVTAAREHEQARAAAAPREGRVTILHASDLNWGDRPRVPRCTLADVHTVFRRWLGRRIRPGRHQCDAGDSGRRAARR
jgi:uncharacterized protein with PIN domain